MKKKIQIMFSLIITLSLIVSQTTFVSGNLMQTSSSARNDLKNQLQQTKEETEKALEDYRNSVMAQRLEKLKDLGLKLIDRRLEDLTKAKEKLAETVKLSDENRTEIQNNLEASYNGLSTLRENVENASDVDTLKTLIQSIFYDYRVYIVELPKDRGLRAAGMAEYVLIEKKDMVIAKIEVTIEEYKAAGKDTTVVESLLTDLQVKFDEIQGFIDSAQSNFRAMEPAQDTTQAEAYLEAGKENLNQAKQGIQEAKDIIENIIAELKLLKES